MRVASFHLHNLRFAPCVFFVIVILSPLLLRKYSSCVAVPLDPSAVTDNFSSIFLSSRSQSAGFMNFSHKNAGQFLRTMTVWVLSTLLFPPMTPPRVVKSPRRLKIFHLIFAMDDVKCAIDVAFSADVTTFSPDFYDYCAACRGQGIAQSTEIFIFHLCALRFPAPLHPIPYPLGPYPYSFLTCLVTSIRRGWKNTTVCSCSLDWLWVVTVLIGGPYGIRAFFRWDNCAFGTGYCAAGINEIRDVLDADVPHLLGKVEQDVPGKLLIDTA